MKKFALCRLAERTRKNWAGVPLETFDTLVNFAKKTKTKTGLRIEACRDQRVYEKGKKVSDKEMAKMALIKNTQLGKWNYTIQPREAEVDENIKSSLQVKPEPIGEVCAVPFFAGPGGAWVPIKRGREV